MALTLTGHQSTVAALHAAKDRAFRTWGDRGWDGIQRRQAVSDFLDALDAFAAAFPQDAALFMLVLDPADD